MVIQDMYSIIYIIFSFSIKQLWPFFCYVLFRENKYTTFPDCTRVSLTVRCSGKTNSECLKIQHRLLSLSYSHKAHYAQNNVLRSRQVRYMQNLVFFIKIPLWPFSETILVWCFYEQSKSPLLGGNLFVRRFVGGRWSH